MFLLTFCTKIDSLKTGAPLKGVGAPFCVRLRDFLQNYLATLHCSAKKQNRFNKSLHLEKMEDRCLVGAIDQGTGSSRFIVSTCAVAFSFFLNCKCCDVER